MNDMFDFTNFDEDQENKLMTTVPYEIIDKNDNELFERDSVVKIAPTNICDVLNSVINSLQNVISSFNSVRVEKEKTRQIEYQTEAFIKMQEEETKRVKIKEIEKTKRLKLELQDSYIKARNELIMFKLNLEKEREEIKQKNINRNLNQEIIRNRIKNTIKLLDEHEKMIYEAFKLKEQVKEENLNYVYKLRDDLLQMFKLLSEQENV